MTRTELHATVARLTGDSLHVVKQLGFGVLHACPVEDQLEVALTAMDCPSCGSTMVLSWDDADPLPAVADCKRCSIVFDYRDDEVFSTELDDLEISASRSFLPAI